MILSVETRLGSCINLNQTTIHSEVYVIRDDIGLKTLD